MSAPVKLGPSPRRQLLCAALLVVLPASAMRPASAAGPVTLQGHVPERAMAASQWLGRAPANQTMSFSIALPLRDQPGLTDLLSRLYDPSDPRHGQFIAPDEFAARFAPTQADYEAVAKYAQGLGLTVVGTHANRLLLDVAAPVGAVERGLGLSMHRFQASDGRVFRAPDTDPTVSEAIAARVSGFIGLDTAYVRHTHLVEKPNTDPRWLFAPLAIGSGPSGGMTPSDIRKAYELTGVTRTGAGQTLAVFELDGYSASDIAAYEKYFGLPSVPLQNVLVDGATGRAGSGAEEVVLDIELQIALASGASKIMVYEGPNTDQGVLDTYNKIATDNLAKQISTSWGIYESANTSSFLNSEHAIFQQMAAQGQAIFSAAGDAGALDNGRSRSVDDPASQPYVVGVGGTRLATNGAGGTWKSETTWNSGSASAGAGGGGISAVWPIPSYQTGIISTASHGSTSMRNVPDVSLNADPSTGYAIYYGGKWHVYGGTSCVAPLWAGFTALVNQDRVANGKAVIGFPNPAIYAIGASATSYAADFHDIADGSTNLYYPAVAGYDDATGWGSFIGSGLFAGLTGSTPGTVAPPPSGPQQLLQNPGFESGPASWIATAGVFDNSYQEPAHTGSWKAWLDGYGRTHTDTLYQDVTIPSTVTSATLTFWLHIDTAETGSAANDGLTLQIRNTSSKVLATLATYSNLNKNTGYAQKTFDLKAYKGQTIRIYFTATENNSKQTSFVLDDFALNVQ